MINSRTIDGVHRPGIEANKYSAEELMLMKTQDIGYVLQKVQSERKKIEKLTAVLHGLESMPSNKHVYYTEHRGEIKELHVQHSGGGKLSGLEDVPANGERTNAVRSYRELQARKERVNQLENLYMEMTLQKELQKKGRKWKLRDDEIVCPTSRPVYKWQTERKR